MGAAGSNAVLLIDATIFGLGIATAVLFHEGSSLVVVANALRLLDYKGNTKPTRVHA